MKNENQPPALKTAKQILDDVEQWPEYHGIVCDPDDVLVAMETYAAQFKNQFRGIIEGRIAELEAELKNTENQFSIIFIDDRIEEAKHILNLIL